MEMKTVTIRGSHNGNAVLVSSDSNANFWIPIDTGENSIPALFRALVNSKPR